jgi:DNA-binding response OmpR family regulator
MKASHSILVVDDSALMRETLCGHLTKQGYQVVQAVDGSRALDLLRERDFDLVLLDVEMPGINGLEVLSLIREKHSIAQLPVIIVTGRDQSGDTIAALQMGANDYVTKPPNLPLVAARVQTQLAVKRDANVAVASAADGAGARGSTNGRSKSGSGTSSAGQQVFTKTDHDGITLGEYQILEELGRGGMGAVFKARHARMNRLVALKVIDKEYLANPDAVRRFYKEIEAASQLSHPNIVIAYDAGQVDDTHYFAMEYVPGIDLDRLVQQRGRLNIRKACDYIRQAALGLQHAHERGMVHRDIKPSNLIVTIADETAVSNSKPGAAAEATVKILDMGLARLGSGGSGEGQDGALTQEGKILGTADFMAPEQWRDARKVDIRSDLYSLGCTLYFLLTAQLPFPNAEPMEKMLKHCLDQPTPVEQLRPEVPEKVITVVRRLMAKKPEARYQAPRELAELLGWLVQSIRD